MHKYVPDILRLLSMALAFIALTRDVGPVKGKLWATLLMNMARFLVAVILVYFALRRW